MKKEKKKQLKCMTCFSSTGGLTATWALIFIWNWILIITWRMTIFTIPVATCITHTGDVMKHQIQHQPTEEPPLHPVKWRALIQAKNLYLQTHVIKNVWQRNRNKLWLWHWNKRRYLCPLFSKGSTNRNTQTNVSVQSTIAATSHIHSLS